MNKPIIGVFSLSSYESPANDKIFYYAEAVRDAGGIPFIVPIIKNIKDIENLVNKFDGFLFTGGQDIDPKLYNEEKKEYCEVPYKDRDYMEIIALKSVIEKEKPLLAVCRGFQLLNAILGGSLYQDIKFDKNNGRDSYHLDKKNTFNESHKVKIIKNSLLGEIINNKEFLGVNSIHHQGIKTLAPSLKEAAISEDGLIESVYMEGKKFILGVQWHPELLYTKYDEHYSIFKKFIESCN